MKLNAKQIENLKEPGKYFDGGGLYVEVTKTGSKLWRLKYRIAGRERRASLGAWPDVTLKEARQRAAETRERIRIGVDPVQEKKSLREAARAEKQHNALTFEKVALEWLEAYRQGRAYKTWENARGRLANHVLPHIGALPFLDVKRSDYAAVVSRLPTGTPKSTGHKVASILKLIEDHGVDHYDLPANRAQGLTRNIKADPESVRHHAAITDEKELARWLPVIENFCVNGKADPLIRYAFRLLILTGARIGALLQAEWQELDLPAGVWHIPAAHEKDRKPMDVYLSRQAVAAFQGLRDYHALYEGSLSCFPSIRGRTGARMSVQTVEKAVKKIIPFTVSDLHGWRTTFTTACKAYGWPHSIVTQSISHSKPGTAADHAYDRAQFVELRRALVQWYADYLDALREGRPLPPVDLKGGELFGL